MTLPKTGTDRAWREAARACLAARLPPEAITWSRGPAEDILFAQGEAPAPARPGPIRVPEGFVALAAQVAWHRDPERFARLYAMLWRLRADAALMRDPADRDLAALRRMERAVTRDVHRLRAAVRFREIGPRGAPRRRFAAWVEPAHYTLEPAAPFFARRFAEMDFSIATPDLVLHAEGGALRFGEGVPPPDLPGDAAEEAWLAWFRRALDPARGPAVRALAELPGGFRAAPPRAPADLLADAGPPPAPAPAPVYAARLAARAAAPRSAPPRPAPPPEAPRGRLAALREEEGACTRCPLHAGATRAVPGEGPERAPLMLVGEQPGDPDERAGRPFQGPAGQLLDQLLREAGIERGEVFLTNALKHAKRAPEGGGRVHASPGGGEIAACRHWLAQELSLVGPRLVVALGASAAEALTGSREGILRRRGTLEEGPGCVPVLLTVHPSFLLRLPDPVAREMETERLRQDLAAAKAHLERLMAG